MKNHKLNGPDYLVLNHDIAARKIDRDKAVQALAGLRLVAKDLGLPGKYLADSIGRFRSTEGVSLVGLGFWSR